MHKFGFSVIMIFILHHFKPFPWLVLVRRSTHGQILPFKVSPSVLHIAPAATGTIKDLTMMLSFCASQLFDCLSTCCQSTMRLLPFFVAIAAFATTTFAQGVSIGAPSNHASVTPGKSLKVRVDKPVSYIIRCDPLLCLPYTSIPPGHSHRLRRGCHRDRHA